MRPRTGKDSRGDVFLLVLLIGLLLGGAALMNRRSGKEEPRNESIVVPRNVPAELVRFREQRGIDLSAARLRGLAIGPDDRIHVLADFQILVYEPDGTFVRSHELDIAPHCGAFGPDGRLYLGLGQRVGVMDLSTGKLTEWSPLGEQSLIGSVAVGEKSVLAGDSGARTLWVFDLDGKEITHLSNAGAAEGTGQAPSVHFDVARATDGTFWCTDAGRHTVLHYSADGALLGRIGEQGEEIGKFGGCCNPAHIAAFADGRLLTVEKKPDLVKVLRSDGSLDCVVAPPESFVLKTFLADAATDSKGRVLVLDPKQCKVRIFTEGVQ